VADPVGVIAGAVGDGVVAGEGPHLPVALEAGGAADAGLVGGSIHLAQAGDSDDMADRGVGQEGDEAGAGVVDDGFDGLVLAEEPLELIGQGGGLGLGQQDGVVRPGAQGGEQGWAGATGVLA
jgi:hypothetical protein